MSLSIRTLKRLRDASVAGHELRSYVEGVSRDAFLEDRTLQLVAERLLEIVGEALHQAERANPEITALLPDLRDIVGTRNRLIHGYDDVDLNVIWAILEHELQPTIELVDSLLEKHPPTPGF